MLGAAANPPEPDPDNELPSFPQGLVYRESKSMLIFQRPITAKMAACNESVALERMFSASLYSLVAAKMLLLKLLPLLMSGSISGTTRQSPPPPFLEGVARQGAEYDLGVYLFTMLEGNIASAAARIGPCLNDTIGHS